MYKFTLIISLEHNMIFLGAELVNVTDRDQ